jgi:hypothetical protein
VTNRTNCFFEGGDESLSKSGSGDRGSSSDLTDHSKPWSRTNWSQVLFFDHLMSRFCGRRTFCFINWSFRFPSNGPMYVGSRDHIEKEAAWSKFDVPLLTKWDSMWLCTKIRKGRDRLVRTKFWCGDFYIWYFMGKKRKENSLIDKTGFYGHWASRNWSFSYLRSATGYNKSGWIAVTMSSVQARACIDWGIWNGSPNRT